MTDMTENEIENKIEFEPQEPQKSQPNTNANKKQLIIGIVAGILLISIVIFATYFLFKSGSDTIQQIRDVFIIFMALASIVLGIALVILIVQLAVLINLLQNEIRPILDSTTETVNTLKGTTQFISNNLTEPIIKLNQYLAMFKRLIKPSRK